MQWLRKTNRKALFAALQKIREGIPHWRALACSVVQACLSLFHTVSLFLFSNLTKRNRVFIPAELMLLGVISLLLSQTAHWISEICVPSSAFSSKFYACSEEDFDHLRHLEESQTSPSNHTFGGHVCREVIKWHDSI
jgi:hypothetical protein